MTRRPLLALACACATLLALASCGHPGAASGQRTESAGAPQTAGLLPICPPRPTTPTQASTGEVVGLMVHAPTANSTEHFERLGFAGTFNRSRLAIQLHHAPGGIIDLLADESTVEWFGDDKGTNLVDPDGMFGPLEMMPDIAEDGGSLVFVVGSNRSPHAQASRLEARGTIVAVCATATAKHRAEVTFKKGEKFQLGPYAFEITNVGKSDWSEGWTLELTSKTDLASIITYSLVANGAEEELRQSMSMSGMGTWQQTLEREAAIEKGTLQIECWSDPAKVELPFAVSAGLGLR